MKDFDKPMNFLSLLKSTKKYKDLFYTLEGRLALAISLVLSYFFVVPYILENDCNVVKSTLFTLSCCFIPTSIILLMLLVISFTLTCKMITQETIKNIEKTNREFNFINVLFSFYYLGFLLVVNILLFVSMLFCGLFGIPHITILIFCYSTLLLYLNFFIVFYTFNLIHLNINLFFLNYKMSK